MEPQYKILIIDSNRDSRLYYQKYLKKHEFRVKIAKNALEGLEKLREEKFQITLVNINLPQINAIELIQLIQDENLNTEVIIISEKNEGNRDDAIAAINLGVKGWFEKSPLQLRGLLEKVTHLAESSGVDGIDRLLSSLPQQHWNII
jgi:DNA-binding NtrC family response regulator